MKELLEYCKTSIRCEWLLTKDALYIGNNLASDKLCKLVFPLFGDYCNVCSLQNDGGLLFIFNKKGFASSAAKFISKAHAYDAGEPGYILGGVIKHKCQDFMKIATTYKQKSTPIDI